MAAIPHAALALTSALDRFGHARSRMLEAVTGAGDADMGAAPADTAAAKAPVKTGVAVIRLFEALLEIGQERPSR